MTEQQTMLYRRGTMITCGPYSLDHITVDDSKIDETLAKGWYRTPKEADDAAETAEEEARTAAEEKRVAALQAQIDANNEALAQNGQKPAAARRPKKDAGSDDNTGE